MENVIQTDAALTAFRTLADGTYRLIFDLNEIKPDVGAAIMALHRQFGCLVFATEGAKITKRKPKIDNGKSQSQRLRAVIFKYQEFLGNQEDSEAFYFKTMETVIEQFKAQMGPK